MHRQTGIAAGLATATAIITIAADPAAADPRPLPLPSVVVDLLPDRSPTATAPEAQTTTAAPAKPTSTKPIKTTDPKTRETAAVRTTHGGGQSSAAQRGTAASPSLKPSSSPTLRPAVPSQIAEPAGGPIYLGGGLGADRWYGLGALAILALVAVAFGRMHGREQPVYVVDLRAGAPEVAAGDAGATLEHDVELYKDAYSDGFVDCATLKKDPPPEGEL